MSSCSSCCNCCAMTSLIGVVFFGITAAMVKLENTVFLTHKAGMKLGEITQDAVNEKFMAMVYTSIVSLISQLSALLLTSLLVCCLGFRGLYDLLLHHEFLVQEEGAQGVGRG